MSISSIFMFSEGTNQLILESLGRHPSGNFLAYCPEGWEHLFEPKFTSWLSRTESTVEGPTILKNLRVVKELETPMELSAKCKSVLTIFQGLISGESQPKSVLVICEQRFLLAAICSTLAVRMSEQSADSLLTLLERANYRVPDGEFLQISRRPNSKPGQYRFIPSHLPGGIEKFVTMPDIENLEGYQI